MLLDRLALRGPAGEPVDFRRLITSHGLLALPPSRRDDTGDALTVTVPCGALRARGAPAALEVRLEEDLARHVALLTSWSVPVDARMEVVALVSRMLALDRDLSGFYRLARADPDLAWVEAGAGRMVRGSTVFEDVVRTLCTTNCSWAATTRMLEAIVGLGEPAPGPALPGRRGMADGRAFPTPEVMAAVGVDWYRRVARAGYRAPALQGLAVGVACGALELESLADEGLVAHDEAVRSLLALPGVGPYAAAHVLHLLGRAREPVLDSWTRPSYARLTGLEGRPVADVDRAIQQRVARYGPDAGLAFWLLVTRDWVT